jgi:hypothetical protein
MAWCTSTYSGFGNRAETLGEGAQARLIGQRYPRPGHTSVNMNPQNRDDPDGVDAGSDLRMRYRALGLFHQVSRPLIAMTTVRALASDMTILLGRPSTSPV